MSTARRTLVARGPLAPGRVPRWLIAPGLALWLGAPGLGGAASLGCAQPLPTPAIGEHQVNTPVPVPYPPPPAKVELVPPQPDEAAVWVDGTWRWSGRNYSWEPGGWVVPQAHDYYAPAMTVRRRNGELMYFAGTWHEGGKAPAQETEEAE